jgi:hypothetical protein
MSEAPRTSDRREQPGVPAAHGPPTYPGTPRWVWVSVGVFMILVVLFVVLSALGLHSPGGHGP